MLDALEANRWLVEVDGVLSGYLPSPAHVRFAVSLVERVRRHRPDARFVCDPVLGDDPKGLYVDAGTALTVRDALIAHANIITPNRFELGWLSGRQVHDSSSAIEAARALRATTTLATSIPSADKTVANILVTPRGAVQCVVEQRAAVPHGTGDFMAALFTGFCLSGGREEDHLARAAAAVACVVEASLGRDELELVAARETWLRAQPLPVDVL
jgi:pyridoxine kinase